MPTPFGINTTPFKRAAEATMTATAIVGRKVQVADATGGFVDTYPTVFTSKCFFYRADIFPLERETTFTVQSIILWNFGFPEGTTILPTDRITVGSRMFEVITGASSSFDLISRAVCREIL